MARAPSPPAGLDPAAKRTWRAARRQLIAQDDWTDSAEPTLEAYVRALHDARKARKEAGRNPVTTGSMGQPVVHPLLRFATQRERDAQRAADQLRLTPSSRRREEEEDSDGTPATPELLELIPKLKWRFADFNKFAEHLTVPSGEPFELEPFWRFILKIVFRTGLVELLVLLPKGNGKTTVLAALAVFHLLVTGNAQAFVAAADKDQANELYSCAQHYVESDGALLKHLAVRESTKRILSRRDKGFLRVVASDKTRGGGKKHSPSPTLVIIEELHAHENDNAYVALRTAAFKRGAIVLDISTAGWDPGSTLGRLRAGMLKFGSEGGKVRRGLKVDGRGRCTKSESGRLTMCESRSRRSVMLEWSCRADDDLDDPAVVKLSNPSKLVSIDSIEDAREAPGVTPWAFARFRANVWTLGFKSWLPANAWEDLAIGEFDEGPYSWEAPTRRTCLKAPPRLGVADGDKVFAAVDMARYRDSAAVVVVAPREKQPPAVWLAFVEASRGPDAPIDYDPIKDAIRALDEHYRLLACGWDPRYFDQSATELDREGIPMAKFDQTNERMCPASANLRREIIAQKVCHDGDPILSAHVIAGATKDIGADAFKIVKGSKSAPPIDALVATAMAHQLAFFRPKKARPFVEVVA